MQSTIKCWQGAHASCLPPAPQVQSITKCMRAYLDTIDGIDRRLPLWVGFTGVENHCCNIFTIVSGC